MIVINLYIFLLALVLALLEIQIEGAHGWAQDLPAWRPNRNHWSYKLLWKIMKKELTGYHAVLITFLLLFFHFPYIMGAHYSLENELKTLSIFFIFASLWDYLWFVLNPHYPLKKFKGEHVWWHKSWFLGFPVDYYGSVVSSFLILLPLFLTGIDTNIYSWWISNIALFIGETTLVILFSLFILKIDHWQIK